MSSIVIKGNTSGQVEIAAPAVAGSTTLTLPTGSGNIIKDDGSGNLSVSGAITGTGGIYLGGTAAANLLDDYEEGTWTPTAAVALTNVAGHYTRIGDVCFVRGHWSYGANSNPGAAHISGLPFTVSATLANYVGNIGYTTYGAWFAAFANINSTFILIRNAGNADISCASLSTHAVSFSAAYMVS